MKQTKIFFLSLSFIIAFGFLWLTNRSKNIDYKILESEINEVAINFSSTEKFQLDELRNKSKKKTSYSNLIPDYLELKKKVLLELKADGLFTNEIYKTNLSELGLDDNQYIELALKTDSPRLTKLYTQMALSHYLKEVLDSISPPTKNLKYSSELVTINEPKTYHVGNEYPIYFSIVNTIVESQSDLFKIVHNGNTIPSSKLPLIYNVPQPESEFIITPKDNRSNLYSGIRRTNNHVIKITN